ncbi:uncharacterized protein [Dermacentor andersoni]|uniref:uncharacterized protein isoform X2 n=1 Tax=Dermacentor andersoni TaxID=34620 RepID=UPI002415B51B|nr:uncharacterized protein LOC126521334 isoform X2 [Dermacentor andersoni]
MLLVGLTSVNDLQQLLKFAKKCDVVVLVKHHYSVPSKCVITDPFLKPIEEQDYENLAALTRESDFETAVGLSLPMAVAEYHLNSTAYTIGSSCNWERWIGYANTCPNPKMQTEYDTKYAKSIQRNGSMIYSFQDERVVVEQVLMFMKKLKQGCFTAFYVEYEDWTGDCSARQPVTRLKMISSQLNRTADAESAQSDRTTPVQVERTSTAVHMEYTTTPVHGEHTIRKHPQSHEPNQKREEQPMKREQNTKGVFIICLFSRRLPNLPLAAQMCPYMAYMGLMHHASNDRFYINDDAALYQFLTLKQYNVQHLIIATAPMHSHLLTQLRQTFLEDGVSRLMYSISEDQPLESLHGVMLLATSVVHLDSLYDVSLDIRNYLHTKMHLKLYLAVQSVGYNTSFDPFLKLKSSCDRLILYTNPYVPSPHCKIMPIIYQDLDMLDKTFFKSKKESEFVPCITLNLAVRRYELASGSSDFGQDCAKEHWEKFSATCPDEPGERGYTATSAYLKTSKNVLVFEDETSIEKKLSKFQQINPSMCVMATAIEREDWNNECSARPAASRMLAIAKYGGTETVPRTLLTNGILICVVDRAPLIKMLPGGLCTHLVYSSVLYRLSSEHTFVAGDGTAFYAASNLALKSGMHFLSEIDLISFFNINVDHAFAGFLASSTKWVQETHQNGLAFMNIPNKTDNVKFASIIKKTWEHILTHKLQQMLLVGIDYRTEASAALVKSLSGKCTFMVFITHPRKSCCEGPCKVDYPSRPQTDEDSNVMQKIELGSGFATTPCISFSMAVRVFHGVNNTTCRREEWASYNQVCNKDQVSDQGSFGSLSSDGNVFMFETPASIKDRISRVSSKVKVMCAAVFDLDLEDTNGSCASGGVAFPRLQDIQQKITAVKNTTDHSTNTEPPESEKTWSESVTPEKPTLESWSESETPEKSTSETWSESETPKKSTSGILICVVDRAPLIKMLPGGLCTHLVYSSVLYRLSSEHTFVAGDGTAFYAASNLALKSGMHFLSEIDLISFFSINVDHGFAGFLASSTRWVQETRQNGLAFMNIPNKTDNVKFASIIKKTWEHILTHKLQQILLVGIDYRTEASASLVKSLSGKCTFMVFITHPRKSCCEGPCKVDYPSRPQTDEDSNVMQKIELGSGFATTPCISFSMAVRVFHGVNNTTCRREEWASYNQVCNKAEVSDQGSFGSLSSDGNVFMFETPASIKDRILRVSSKVKVMCAAVFDLDLEDTNGSCASGAVAFPRLQDIQQEITAVKNTTDHSTNTAPPESEKTWSESVTPEKPTLETWSESETPEKSTSETRETKSEEMAPPEKEEITHTEHMTESIETGETAGHTGSSQGHQTGQDTTGTPSWWQTPETQAESEEITHTERTTESAETGDTAGHTEIEER